VLGAYKVCPAFMNTAPSFDLATAHRYLAAFCFNQTWGHLENADRSAADNEEMRALAHASLWHWQQRKDCTSRNLTIAFWLLSRVYAVLLRPTDASEYGFLALKFAEREPAYFLGYAYEALARAAALHGDRVATERNLALAWEQVALVRDDEGRTRLRADLDEIGTQVGLKI